MHILLNLLAFPFFVQVPLWRDAVLSHPSQNVEAGTDPCVIDDIEYIQKIFISIINCYRCGQQDSMLSQSMSIGTCTSPTRGSLTSPAEGT